MLFFFSNLSPLASAVSLSLFLSTFTPSLSLPVSPSLSPSLSVLMQYPPLSPAEVPDLSPSLSLSLCECVLLSFRPSSIEIYFQFWNSIGIFQYFLSTSHLKFQCCWKVLEYFPSCNWLQLINKKCLLADNVIVWLIISFFLPSFDHIFLYSLGLCHSDLTDHLSDYVIRNTMSLLTTSLHEHHCLNLSSNIKKCEDCCCRKINKKKICVARESNPGHLLGRQISCHWTSDATWEILKFIVL